MKTHIIGLCGLADTGKDTVADLLLEHAGFRKLAFADALRGEIADGYGIDMQLLTERSTKETPTAALALCNAPDDFRFAMVQWHVLNENPQRTPAALTRFLEAPRSPRTITQWWGTEYRRSRYPNYWTLLMSRRIDFYRRDGKTRFVITDCRFDNEVDLLRAIGGRLWQITRPGIDAASTAEGKHVSATDGARFKPDLTLRNEHDIRHLQGIVRDAFCDLEWPGMGAPS